MADVTPLQGSIIIWVATDGNDVSGTGSELAPYLTIERALLDFTDGRQIRIKDGTYIPTDSIVISGLRGSLFAENPNAVYIQPVETKAHQACLAIIDTDRFSIAGINILQAADPTGNIIGIYAENVENFIAYTCQVSNFAIPSGVGYGIFAAGGGRIQECKVNHIYGNGEGINGIVTYGIDIIDCKVEDLSGVDGCWVRGCVEDGMYSP